MSYILASKGYFSHLGDKRPWGRLSQQYQEQAAAGHIAPKVRRQRAGAQLLSPFQSVPNSRPWNGGAHTQCLPSTVKTLQNKATMKGTILDSERVIN